MESYSALSSPSTSDSTSNFSDDSLGYTMTDLNEVTRQYGLYKEKLRLQRQDDIKKVLQISYFEDDASAISNIPTEMLLPQTSINMLHMYGKK